MALSTVKVAIPQRFADDLLFYLAQCVKTSIEEDTQHDPPQPDDSRELLLELCHCYDVSLGLEPGHMEREWLADENDEE